MLTYRGIDRKTANAGPRMKNRDAPFLYNRLSEAVQVGGWGRIG